MSNVCKDAFEAWIKTIENDSDYDPSTADSFEEGWKAAVKEYQEVARYLARLLHDASSPFGCTRKELRTLWELCREQWPWLSEEKEGG